MIIHGTTAELSGFELDCAMAKAMGHTPVVNAGRCFVGPKRVHYSPSVDAEQIVLLIEAYRPDVTWRGNLCTATIRKDRCRFVQRAHSVGVAVCRALVNSRLGATVSFEVEVV